MPKETGIIMSGDHPQLILDGTKTMTRRTWGLEKINEHPHAWEFVRMDDGFGVFRTKGQAVIYIKCPYGGVGDRLWVREMFWIQHDSEWSEYSGKLIDCGTNIAEDDWAEVRYCATDTEPSESDMPLSIYSKRPSIHMPRWASRILLEITELRAERLQEITLRDCLKEGVVSRFSWLDAFADMWDWDCGNAKRGYGWDMNPWVWVISFKRDEG